MKLLIDDAHIDLIKKICDYYPVDGVTTNPSLIAKEGRDFIEVVKEISTIVDGPISAEVISLDHKGMVEEADKLSKIHKNIVIKLPMTLEGLSAVRVLSQEGIKTNVTLVFSVHQGVLAAKAGATYISPFVGRLDDIGLDGMDLINDLIIAKQNYGFKTEIIAASVRHPMHVTDAALAGAHIATVPAKLIDQMLNHPLTTQGIERFKKDWADAFGDK